MSRLLVALAATLIVAAPASAATAPTSGPDARYALAHGCYDLQSAGKTVAGPFRMQATRLGSYLLYGKDRDFLTADGDGVAMAAEPSPQGDWTVDVHDGAFRLRLGDRTLGVSGGALTMAGGTTGFAFAQAGGCPEYPEVQNNATGTPTKGASDIGQVLGTADLHLHHMAFEFLGGSLHCGRPWHPYGVAYALPDCSQEPGSGAQTFATDTVLTGGNAPTDQVGWPTFTQWPNHRSLAYEQTYWKWMERAWLAGLRLYVNLFVENEALCKVYPFKRNACNDMASVRLQHKDIFALQDYIDAQYGGPGKGFFRIVTDPFEARRVINDGKLAVVLGIEVSRLFECGVYNDVPDCSREKIDRGLDEVWKMGVRGMEIVNKFDNAFSGVAGDGGIQGPIVNVANKEETGTFWKMETCTGDAHAHDNEQMTPSGNDRDSLFNAFQLFLPPGQLPLYPAAPHCNTRGLTDLGAYLVRRMMEKGMLIDPDHMGAYARDQLMTLVEAKRYAGLISSHSWSDDTTYPRIYDLTGAITPYAGSSTGFVKQWEALRKVRNDRVLFGFGYGADMNGFGSQGGPRGADAKNPVTYPFKAMDPKVTIDKQRSGERVFDINVDGVAHYGLYADWLEDLRKLGGDQIVDDMARGAEAYLQTWERAQGIPAPACRGVRARVTTAAVAGIPLGADAAKVLHAVGQPRTRGARGWRYCIAGTPNRGKRVGVAFNAAGRVALIATPARRHRAGTVGPGARATAVRGARALAPGLLVRRTPKGRATVFGVRKGRVAFVALASRQAARDARTLRSYLRRAGIRA